MKKQNHMVTAVMLIFVMLGFVFSGCAGKRVKLMNKGVVSIERMPSKVRGLYFHNVNAYKEGDGLVVSGNVKRRYTSVAVGSGHVDVAVISPDGNVVKYVSTAYSPKVISKRSHPGSHFEVRLPVVPLDGSTVRVAIHENTILNKTNNNGFDCGENVAIPSG